MNPIDEKAIADAIDAAESVADPLDGLVERVATDPGAPFEPGILACLSELRRDDPAAFEGLRSQLEQAGCRVAEFDNLIAQRMVEAGGRGPGQSDTLVALAADARLFHTPEGQGYADVKINGHRETWPIRGKGFMRWLTRGFYQQTHGAPNPNALQSALNVIEARAQFDGPSERVYIRVAGHEGRLYLDLADDHWRAVEIDKDGWRIVNEPPVRFRRAAGMQPLPVPVSGESVKMLRSFINVRSDADFVLAIAWLLAALRDDGPYPVLVLSGEQGSAKSTLSAILRKLIDPNTAPLRALPREERDLFIAATNAHVLTFDNVSRLPAWISDTLCRLATGGGFAVRQLYTDQDEILFNATRPVILNGIEDIANRPDLADRAIFLTLEPIPDERRLTEDEIRTELENIHPQILGALLDAVSCGLLRLPETKLEKLPRMADFARWVTACEQAVWQKGTFLQAYACNTREAVDNVIAADLVGSTVCSLMESRTEWTGTASDLLADLSRQMDERVAKTRNWPATASVLSNRLRRAATFLRKIGIDVKFTKEGRARTRLIQLSRVTENSATEPSAPSASSAVLENASRDCGFGTTSSRKIASHADDNGGAASCQAVRNETRESAPADAADDADGSISSHPVRWKKVI